MNFVSLISGGKDSCYNTYLCEQYGHKLICLANLRSEVDESQPDEELNSFMYQTVGSNLVQVYSSCFNVPMVQRVIRGKSLDISLTYSSSSAHDGDEVEDLYELLVEVKRLYPAVQAVACGAIYSNYQRHRVELIAVRLGLQVLAYLWQRERFSLLREMVLANGMVILLIKVCGGGLTIEQHLGRVITAEDIQLSRGITPPRASFLSLQQRCGLDVCGEGGEYEFLVLDMPCRWTRCRLQIIGDRMSWPKVIEQDGSTGYLQLTAGQVAVMERTETAATEATEATATTIAEGEERQRPLLPDNSSGEDHLISLLTYLNLDLPPPSPPPVSSPSPFSSLSSSSYPPRLLLSPSPGINPSPSLPSSPSSSPASPGFCTTSLLLPLTLSLTSPIPTTGEGRQEEEEEKALLLALLAEQLSSLLSSLLASLSSLADRRGQRVELVYLHLYYLSPPPISSTSPSSSLSTSSTNPLSAAVFSTINTVYARFISSLPLPPPSRACLALPCPLLLPLSSTTSSPSIVLDASYLLSSSSSPPATLSTPPIPPPLREVLHVKARSAWAPQCIGPYSQAQHLLGRGQGLVLVAGQIPLDPATMQLRSRGGGEGGQEEGQDEDRDLLLDCLLCLRHVARILACLQSDLLSSCLSLVVYLVWTGDEDRDRRRAQLVQVLIARLFTTRQHQLYDEGKEGQGDEDLLLRGFYDPRYPLGQPWTKTGYGTGLLEGEEEEENGEEEEEEDEEEEVAGTVNNHPTNRRPVVTVLGVSGLPRDAQVEVEALATRSDLLLGSRWKHLLKQQQKRKEQGQGQEESYRLCMQYYPRCIAFAIAQAIYHPSAASSSSVSFSDLLKGCLQTILSALSQEADIDRRRRRGKERSCWPEGCEEQEEEIAARTPPPPPLLLKIYFLPHLLSLMEVDPCSSSSSPTAYCCSSIARVMQEARSLLVQLLLQEEEEQGKGQEKSEEIEEILAAISIQALPVAFLSPLPLETGEGGEKEGQEDKERVLLEISCLAHDEAMVETEQWLAQLQRTRDKEGR